LDKSYFFYREHPLALGFFTRSENNPGGIEGASQIGALFGAQKGAGATKARTRFGGNETLR